MSVGKHDLSALRTAVSELEYVNPRQSNKLRKLGIETVYDLLLHVPSGYSKRKDVALALPGEEVALYVKAIEVKSPRSRKAPLKICFKDDTGLAEGLIFNANRWHYNLISSGEKILVLGKVENKGFSSITLTNPAMWDKQQAEAEGLLDINFFPKYPLTEGISNAVLSRMIRLAAKEFAWKFEEYLPADILKKREFATLAEAVRWIHLPKDREEIRKAMDRLRYHELFLLEISKAVLRAALEKIPGNRIDPDHRRILECFPFELTSAQMRAIDEIRADIASGRSMNRLLQGDVGSGKTVVACYGMFASALAGHQSCILAPTEILARQHEKNIRDYAAKIEVGIELLISSMRTKERRETLAKIKSGESGVLIGTHAVIEDRVEFDDLGFIVIDEQHKFGVVQREALVQKGIRPHVLVMSATPIPRTLSLAVFGDLDVSIIDELPPGRKPVSTRYVPEAKRSAAMAFIHDYVKFKGAQAYVICPAVQTSDMDIAKAEEEYVTLSKIVFPDLRVGLVHGKLTTEEKVSVMKKFADGEIDILVASVVVEVGVDVPGASVMVIENAERFGLAQLHQLRGRIGRGTQESHLFLFADPSTENAKERLRAIVDETDGFKIAERDLVIRGFGDFLGTKQHGVPNFKIADPVQNMDVLEIAKEDAFGLARVDPYATDLAQKYLVLHRGEGVTVAST
ncbi:MAG: ATP-dependent DNA helicase RecG [Planctomycetes bacterium]|nr:ATP-dependent DNA helicase RecG [Planctomycetota bacterium]